MAAPHTQWQEANANGNGNKAFPAGLVTLVWRAQGLKGRMKGKERLKANSRLPTKQGEVTLPRCNLHILLLFLQVSVGSTAMAKMRMGQVDLRSQFCVVLRCICEAKWELLKEGWRCRPRYEWYHLMPQCFSCLKGSLSYPSQFFPDVETQIIYQNVIPLECINYITPKQERDGIKCNHTQSSHPVKSLVG